MSAARVLVMADRSPFNDWLLPELERTMPLCGILRPSWDTGAVPTRRDRTAPSLQRVMRRLRAAYFAPRDRHHAQQVAERLFGGAQPIALRAPVWTVAASAINSAETLALVQQLAPDVLVVSGAPMLQPPICAAPRCGALNVHLGVAPEYRGMHTLHVPWLERDYEHLGLTLHHITPQVDAGEAVLRAFPALGPDDQLADVEARLAHLAARELRELFAWWHEATPRERIPSRAFAQTGRLIRFHDRRVGADLASRVAHRLGRRAPVLPERVDRCYRR
jgi:methionyl-tRNA formyltransferase